MARVDRVVFSLLLLASCVSPVISQPRLRVEAGLLDARHWNFEEDRLPLQGYWTFYDSVLVTPETLASNRGRDQFFPALWNTNRLHGTGYATYALKILLPDTVTTLALEIPQLYSSCKLWVNGEVVALAGQIGRTKEETTPQWIYQTVRFQVGAKDTVQLVLQLANFHHYKGGMKDPILLGSPKRIEKHKDWAMSVNIAEAAVLIFLGVTFIVLYLVRRKSVILYFALLCLTWSVRAVFSNLYPVVTFYPDFDWGVLVRIEYLSLYFGIIWSVLFLHHLFKNLSHQIITYMLVALNVFFALFTVFTPVIVFSQWVSLYLAVAGVVVVYGGILVIRALLVDQAGAWLLVASILLGVVMFGYDIVAYNAVFSYNFIFLSAGYIGIFLLTAAALLFHLNILKSKFGNATVLTYDDLFKKERK